MKFLVVAVLALATICAVSGKKVTCPKIACPANCQTGHAYIKPLTEDTWCKSTCICAEQCGAASPFKQADKLTEDPCTLPKVVGPCRARLSRFYFNSQAKKCEEFFFGGCQNNANNFATLDECNRACAKPAPVKSTVAPVASDSVCLLPSDTGMCRAMIPRFFFNAKSNTCEEFTWGGCGGNGNNFDSLENCNRQCAATSVVEPSPREEDCEIPSLESPCELPKKVGKCKAMVKAFYFNSETKKCEEFIYGGCEGNANNFMTLAACNNVCPEKKPEAATPVPAKEDTKRDGEKEDACDLPKVVGSCRGMIPAFYFDKETKKCEEFSYGGCDGNANNFETLEKCNNACGAKEVVKKDEEKEEKDEKDDEDVCDLPSAVGDCRGMIPKFFFNSQTKTCEEFTWGGCGGNGNNFETAEECTAKCAKPKDKAVCQLEPARGHCYARLDRFYFDTKTKKCEPFIYGGCGGNDNNFENEDDCKDLCDLH